MGEVVLPHKFAPRDYQLPLWDAMEGGCLRAAHVWHRRSGKDLNDLNIMATKMPQRVGNYYYCLPELKQARSAIWEGKDKNGLSFLEHFPYELRDGEPNQTEMKIKYKGGSLMRLIGADRIDSKMGTNPCGIVLSEYSLMNPSAWDFFRPILAENGGWAIFNFTPRGENHAFNLFNLAMNDPSWFAETLTVDDTHAISAEVLDQERREIMALHGNDAHFLQEYYCSFSVPIAGAYFAAQILQAYRAGRVGNVQHEPMARVNTVWDLGVNDRNSIWFFQVVGNEMRIIDFYENTGMGLPHYVEIMEQKTKDFGYIYGRHIGPHDTKVKEWSSGKTRVKAAAELGVKFEIAPKLPVLDGIDAVRTMFSKCWFDKTKCAQGLNALKSYHKEYNEELKTYLPTPKHDWSSNAADSFRYLATTYNFKRSAERDGRGDYGARQPARRQEMAISPMSC